MQKIDFKKTLPSYKAKHGKVEIIEIPQLQYLMIAGHGDPNESAGEYSKAIQTLFPVAYKLKFMSKLELERDYTVPPLEAIWWAESYEAFTTARDKSQWDWTVMLLLPDWITTEMFEQAKQKVADKNLPTLEKLRLEKLEEGLCVQTLHIGPYDDEAPVLDYIHNKFIPENGLQMTGKHHEIYLSDVRKVDPAKLKTILRQPVAKV